MAKKKYIEWLDSDKLMLLESWARSGLTDEQIAHNIGISRSTLAEWKVKYSDIADALKKGKEVVDIMVENALFKSAMGYEYEEVTTETDTEGRKHAKKVKKYQPPNVTAQIFWLKNRRPEAWREKQSIEVAAVDTTSVDKLKEAIEKRRNGEVKPD